MSDANFIFSSGPIELKEEAENFFVEGYISTSDLDLVNDIVTKECIVDMGEQMRERTIKLDVEHESFRGSNEVELELNKTIIPAAKIDDFLIDKKGLRIRAMLNRHVKRFNEVKNSIKDGFLDAFSIAFIPTKARTQRREGQEVRLLDKVNLLNVAFTGNPVNTHSAMTNVFAKSLEYLKDKEANHNHVSDNKSSERGYKQMNDEDKKEEETSETETSETEEKESESTESEEKAKKRPKEKPKEDEEEEEETKKKKVSKKEEPEAEKPAEKPAEESSGEEEEAEGDKPEEETKSEIQRLKKEMMEVKAVLKQPLLKSIAGQQDKSKNFVEEKALNPLDVIA